MNNIKKYLLDIVKAVVAPVTILAIFSGLGKIYLDTTFKEQTEILKKQIEFEISIKNEKLTRLQELSGNVYDCRRSLRNLYEGIFPQNKIQKRREYEETVILLRKEYLNVSDCVKTLEKALYVSNVYFTDDIQKKTNLFLSNLGESLIITSNFSDGQKDPQKFLSALIDELDETEGSGKKLDDLILVERKKLLSNHE